MIFQAGFSGICVSSLLYVRFETIFMPSARKKYIGLNIRNMAADVVAEFMKHFKNLEKQLGSLHWQQCVDAGN